LNIVVTLGGLYVNDLARQPTLVFTMATIGAAAPLPYPEAHATLVAVDHVAVVHSALPSVVDAVKSDVPKFTPLTTMLANPLVGALVMPAPVITGGS
jgi:hypothetical protein